jgi:NAD(P)H-dependent FMN reductase
MAGKKIIIFLGSTRDGRFGGKVADYIKTALENAGLAPKIFGKIYWLVQ